MSAEDMNGAQAAPVKGTHMQTTAAPTSAKVRRLAPRARSFEQGDHVELGSALLEQLPSDAPPIADLGALHTYSAGTGVWRRSDRSDASKIVQGFSGCSVVGEGKPKPLRLRKSDVCGSIDLAHDQAARVGFFDAAASGLAFSNGFVRLAGDNIAVEPHDPENAARFSYPFAFDVKTAAPKWKACLDDAFQGDADAAEKIACLQEMAGASLFGFATRYQKAIVMFGVGANAKSTIATVIEAAFPEGSTCAVAPQTWGNEYRLALMAGKLLNVVSELPEADILAGEEFKSMVDGSMKTARPIREAPFTFRAKAGHLMNANRLPGSNDQSHGFWRRMIVLTFNRTFAEHEQDSKLAERIIAAELAGVVAWMIEGARRVLAQGRYTKVPSSDAAVANWKRGADPVAQFVKEKTRPIKSIDEREKAKDLFDSYVEWAEKNRFKVMSSHTFGMRMRGIGVGSQHTRTGEVYPVVLLRVGEMPPDDEPEDDPGERAAIRNEARS